MSQESESSIMSGQRVGSSGDRSRLLARAERLLKRLEKEAEAARAEARHAELQRLLADAKTGDDRELQVWLRQHDHASVAADDIADRKQPAFETRSGDVQLPANARNVGAWEDYLPAARQRLQARARQLEAKGPTPQKLNAAGAKSATRQLRVDKPAKQTRSGVDASPSVDEKRASLLKELVKSFDNAEQDPRQSPHKKTLLFFRVGGLSASIVLHIVIVIVLAVLTIKLPAPPASLSLEASDTPSETFELSEQVEVAEPSQTEAVEPTPETEINLSQDLASVSELTSALSQSVQSPAAGISSPALMASLAKSGARPAGGASSFFGAAATGNCFCYVIDSSSSMKGGPWEAARSELLRSLTSLKAKQRFYIIFYNEDIDAIPMPGEREPARRALYATPENLEHARQWIDTVRIAKGAPPAEAMGLAIDLEPDAIYFLTDGVTKTDLPGFLREKNRTFDFIDGEQVRVTIHAIAFYSLAGQKLMKQVAAENRGQFTYVPDPSKR